MARNPTETRGKVEGTHPSDLTDLLEGLGGDGTLAEVAVERVYPSPGYLRIYVVPPAGPDLLLQQIRAAHGAGTYRLRPYGRRPDGRRGYLPGQVVIELAPDPEDGALVRNPAPSVAAPVVVRTEGSGLTGEILRALLERKDVGLELLPLLLKHLSDRTPAAAGGGTDLDKLFRLAERLTQFGGSGGGGGKSEPPDEASMERMMMLAIFSRIMSPDAPPQAPPQRPPFQGTPAAPRRGTRPRPQPASAAPPPPPPPARPSHEAPVEGRDEDDEEEDDDDMSLEDDLASHLEELSANPDAAVAWLLENVLAKLPPSVRARLAELQAAAHDAGESPRVLNLRGYGGRG